MELHPLGQRALKRVEHALDLPSERDGVGARLLPHTDDHAAFPVYPGFTALEAWTDLNVTEISDEDRSIVSHGHERGRDVLDGLDPPKALNELLLASLAPRGNNEDFLEPADRSHCRLAGLGRGAQRVFQFKPDRVPELVHASCVFELYHDVPNQCYRMHLLRGRCPILGIGGTKVKGHNTWPLVLHHIQYEEPGTPYSLSSFCHKSVNMGIDCIP